jgi:hypothetical protein
MNPILIIESGVVFLAFILSWGVIGSFWIALAMVVISLWIVWLVMH